MQHLIAGSRDSLSQKASYLRVCARHLADSMKSGGFRSLYHGQGIEFAGVREYLRGDDVRSIDWNVTARMGKPYVKMFEEDQELQIFLIVDRSSSMFIGSKGRVKYETAAEVAALLTLAAEQNDSPVGAVFFDGKIHFSSKPEAGRSQSMHLLTKLDEVEHIERGSVMGNALSGAAKILRHHSLVFILSDFRSSGWEEPFKILSQKNDVVAVQVTDSTDWELPAMGTVPFVDSESGKRLVLPTLSSIFKSAWRDDYRKRSSKLENYCIRHGARYFSISTEEDAVRKLTDFFASRFKYSSPVRGAGK
ncbi:MAG: DUF58 domain-containing protein [Treponema sp.]|nr:DUF58 domain-containing protein [Treponema sp.]